MELTIIIPSKDRAAIVLPTLERVYAAIEGIAAEIVVINDSKTAAIVIPDAWQQKVKIFDNPKAGVASARNLGASKAKADLLLFMDDDMWISAGNVRTTIALHQAHPESCCINLNWVYPPELQAQNRRTQFGRYLHHFGFDSLKGWSRGLPWNDAELFASEGITSQYLSMRKADFERSGGYNERFPHAGFEDHDFSKQLTAHGITSYVYPRSMLYHNEADRMSLRPWLARRQRGGETRRVAVQMGYTELEYHYGPLKSAVYRLTGSLAPLLQASLRLVPNRRAFDPLYFWLVNLLLGTALYTGYHARK